MTYTVVANTITTVGSSVQVLGSGVFTINNTCTATIRVKLGSTTLATFVTASITAPLTNLPFNFTTTFITQTGGASGVFETFSNAAIKLTGGAGIGAIYQTANTTTTTPSINLTANQTLSVTIQFSVNGVTANTCTQRMMLYKEF
jgi:hypothetical protein